MNGIRRGALWAIAGLCVGFVVAFGAPGPRVRAQESNRAGLVVRLGDDAVITRCVEFGEPELTGYDLLARSGLRVEMSGSSGMGAAICRIEDVGCPGARCFCQCQGSTCTYWSYWAWTEEGWTYSPLGASTHKVAPGSVEGWSWGNQVAPPEVSFAEICLPAATPTSVSTPTSTLSPTSPATLTPRPTVTREPTQAQPVTLAPTLPSTSTPTLTATVEQAPTAVATSEPWWESATGANYAFLALIVLGLAILVAVLFRRRWQR